MKVLFFDGHCNLCNGTVDWLIRRDSRNRLTFASLQGSTAQERLGPRASDPSDYDTVVYLREGQAYQKSTAILMALGDLGGAWVMLKVFLVVPAPLRDVLYRLVARHRYRLFGRRETCRLPTAAERKKLLP